MKKEFISKLTSSPAASVVLRFYSKYKLYIFPLIITLSSLILIVFVIFPQTLKLVTNQRTQGELSNKSQFLITKAEALENYDIEDLGRKIQYALAAFPADKDFGNAVGFLQNIANQSAFSITSLQLGGVPSTRATAETQSYSLKVDATGPRALLPVFVSNIENSGRLFKISSIEVSSGRDGEVVASLSVDVFYSPPSSNLGSVDSPLPELTSQDEEILATLAGSFPISSQVPAEGENISVQRGKANPFE